MSKTLSFEVQPSAIAYCNLLVVNLILPYNYLDMEGLEYYKQIFLFLKNYVPLANNHVHSGSSVWNMV